jgi:protein-disulfide isomerase-like protein with CxxC motif
MAKKENTNRMKMISALAKKIYAEGKTKKWTDAIKKASTQLKREGKL